MRGRTLPGQWLRTASPLLALAAATATFAPFLWATGRNPVEIILAVVHAPVGSRLGGAASSGDPSWGQGLSLTLRDVRTLRDKLLESEDWDAAGHAYAAAHDEYYGRLHTFEDWFTKLMYEPGEAGKRRRMRLMTGELNMEEFDPFQSGPESSEPDAVTREAVLGE